MSSIIPHYLAARRATSLLACAARLISGLPRFSRSSSKVSVGNTSARRRALAVGEIDGRSLEQKQAADAAARLARDPEVGRVAADEEGRNGGADHIGVERLDLRHRRLAGLAMCGLKSNRGHCGLLTHLQGHDSAQA
ncbi:hypothetical protein QY049_17225 [Bradyrhizobium sp. WYCCWR 13022]|uniref:hypothetical protein n=1 Tax=unclassified Bradyrhizobium TaxID=2631580 RepID=UPI00263ACC3E|nr:hypothetical protein [Bradyrhizobium sp. WYCCWR 13022]MDN4984949.1 hypothetical protein [Bradyrhizobium sp. WYCCWR 13022]